jgi:hypothetical protein
MSKSVEAVIEKFGVMVNGQITIAWDTKQTAEQFLEIRRDGGDSVEFDVEEFVEYVKSNSSEVIKMTLESFGQIQLENEMAVIGDSGEIAE